MPRTVGTVEIDPSKCKGCELCVAYCPEETLAMSEEVSPRGFLLPYEAKDNCTGCQQCARICPDVAITVYRMKKVEAAR
jgi:2-oxoglutarate ferredoxin oxidoreductase subunit delta